MSFVSPCITRHVTSLGLTESTRIQTWQTDTFSFLQLLKSRTGSLLPAGVRKRGRTAVVSLPSSNIAPPPSPGPSSEPPGPDCDSLLASRSDYVPDYSLETVLCELIVLRRKVRQLEDRLNIKHQCRFVLEDCQMQDWLARREREDDVLLEAIDAVANILAAQS
ncbi:hypothetical protein K439DRAFT_1625607 [Ramaria rubella]|nr:hypothetical protein K439DRAFT_1625607 [Ramaria rubella]